LAQRYGASDATVAKVRRELARAGFTRAILDVTRGFLVVPATASQLNAMNGGAREAERAPRRAGAIARIRSGAGGLVQEIVTDPVVPQPAARATGATSRPSFQGRHGRRAPVRRVDAHRGSRPRCRPLTGLR
ncbi:MAG: hypothetical protein ACPG9N_05610, partial [Miltoncostaeaceae bacterium]